MGDYSADLPSGAAASCSSGEEREFEQCCKLKVDLGVDTSTAGGIARP